jgi:hypothetical protein
VAYRDDASDACEAPTADGVLRAELAPRHVKLAVANRSLEIVEAFATMVEHHKKHPAKDQRASIRITGRLLVARDVPRDGMGVWVELDPGGAHAGFRRIFGVDPVNLLEPSGLAGLAALDRLVLRLRHALGHLAGDTLRVIELGSSATGGLDKVLCIEHAEHTEVYARRLFRDRARLAIAAHDDGRIVVRDGRAKPPKPRRRRRGRRAEPAAAASGAPALVGYRELVVQSRHGVTAVGDHLRFTDPQGTDLATVAMPWIAFEDRVELAERVGERVDREYRNVTAWPPRLRAENDPAR